MTSPWILFTVAWLALSAGEGRSQEEASAVVIETGGPYASPEAARATWKPLESGTPPIAVASDGGQPFLKLPCNFAGNSEWRVSWDRQGRWDLARCQVVRLDLVVDRERPAELILYFRSGDGWYGRPFAAPPGRSTVELPRSKFNIEGKPTGWETIDAVRLSVTHDQDEDRAILVGNIQAVARTGRIAIYRNDEGLKAESSVPQCVQQASDRLGRLGLASQILNDQEIAGGKLAGMKVVILPLNPVLSKPAADAVEKFVVDGGKLIGCYCLPKPLDRLLGVTDKGALQGENRLHSFAFAPSGGGPPIAVLQSSGWARRVAPAGDTKARGFWIDKDGNVSTDAAITRNSAGFFIGHVLTPTDEAVKDRLLMAMLGELWPELWKEAYEERLKTFGRRAGFKDGAALLQAARAGGREPAAKTAAAGLLANHQRLFDQAGESAAKGAYDSAAELIARAENALLQAYAAGLPSVPGEVRAVWCHSPFGPQGLTWDQAMQRLSDAGFNAVIPNMLWGGTSAYPSKVLSRGTGLPRDLLAECVAAGKKHGLAVHVWKVDWNLWYNCPPAFKDDLRKAGRLQVDTAGKPVDWLCPSHPDNQKLELDSLLEVVANYDVAGIHFDYIRYPGDGSCYCPGCCQRFEEENQVKAANWPADVTAGPLKEKFRQFRRDNITRLVAAVSEQARKAKPGVKISAAVFWHWPSARNQVAQDWKLWIEKGYLDFVCPMQYTENAAVFEGQTRQTAGWVAGRIPLVPGIGATLGQSPDVTLQQVLMARRQHTAGFVLFNYDRSLFDALDLLKLGATRK